MITCSINELVLDPKGREESFPYVLSLSYVFLLTEASRSINADMMYRPGALAFREATDALKLIN